MPDPAPQAPQIIPRPSDWRPGAPAPWADVADTDRRGIGVARVLSALSAVGQQGPVPAGIGADGAMGPAILVSETNDFAARDVNAGVLGLLFEEEDEARLVLTRRASTLRTHRGEVSFPGGRLHEGEDATEAALREAYEEVALDPAGVTTVGYLHPVMTMVSASLILPVLATVPARPHLVASPDEVERVFDLSLSELAEPRIFREERWRIPGRTIPGSDDNSFPVWFFEVPGEIIWGATARMIHELLSIVLTGRSGR
jgi:8-oxo-dGTP pyrophosphatase MutT (NUDIX family)